MRLTRFFGIGALLGSLLGSAALFGIGSASAVPGDVTIGQTGTAIGNCFSASPGAVVADPSYVVPSDGGVITSFSFQSTSGNAGQKIDFLVLQPKGGTSYKVVGETGVVTLEGTGLETLPADIAVQGGDILGLWQGAGELNNCALSGGSDHIIVGVLSADPTVGATVALSLSIGGFALNESANLVLPGPCTHHGNNYTGANCAANDLSGAHLFNANLSWSNLSWANLSDANLTNANLTGANLTGADLDGVITFNANFSEVTWSNTTCPDGSNSSTNTPKTCIGHGA